ncbi:MAG: YciI family protein, partial [Opitutales bacterium]
VFPWRGPKGIGAEYVRLHKQDPKTPEGMGVQPFFMMYRGSAWEPGQGVRAQVLRAHEAYVEGLRRDGRLAAAGPVPGDGDLLAILIFNRISDEESRRLVEDAPAVKAGVFRVEQHRWWCSAHVLPE